MPLPPADATREPVDAVVVGAGVAGLAAARTLLGAGLTVAVHEARERVGGRLLSSSSGGGAVDLGATWYWPGEPLVQALVDELGLATFPQRLDGDALFEADARGPRRLDGNPVDVVSGRFTDGAQSLARGLAEALPPGVLHLDDPVTHVLVDEDGVTVRSARGTTRARHAVLALPPALAVETVGFRPELPREVRDLAESTAVWMGGVVKAVAVFPTAFWLEAGLAGAAVSHLGPFREVHDHSGPGARPAALFGFAAAASFAGAGAPAVAAAFVEQLHRLFGPAAATPESVHVVDWSAEPRTSPRTPSPRAGTASYGHPLFQQPVAGRVHWASTETATQHAGHVEGALRAGAQAARAVLVATQPA